MARASCQEACLARAPGTTVPPKSARSLDPYSSIVKVKNGQRSRPWVEARSTVAAIEVGAFPGVKRNRELWECVRAAQGELRLVGRNGSRALMVGVLG